MQVCNELQNVLKLTSSICKASQQIKSLEKTKIKEKSRNKYKNEREKFQLLGSWGNVVGKSPCWESLGVEGNKQGKHYINSNDKSIYYVNTCQHMEKMSRLRPVSDSLENVGFVSKGDKKCV
jgi:hypothetical protein